MLTPLEDSGPLFVDLVGQALADLGKVLILDL